MENFFVNIALPAAMFMVIIGAIAAVVLPLIKSFSNPKSLVGTLGGLVILGLIYLIGYGMTGDVLSNASVKAGVDLGTEKIVEASLNMMFILIILAIAGIVVSYVMKLVNKI